MNSKNKGLSFSIELDSRDQIIRASIPDDSRDRLMLEGYAGELTSIELVEDIMLEIRGKKGVLRIELSRIELEKALKRK